MAEETNVERMKKWVKTVLQSRQGRLIVCGGSAVLVVLLVVVILLSQGIGEDERLAGWPSGALMEGIQPPEQGRIDSVQQTDTTVVVYFTEFPESALAAYLQTLGVPSEGGSPYVVQKGKDRFLAISFDPAENRLSLTVTPVQ